ncbi:MULTISPECIES: circadian clock KaiB family protein [Hymenobacter]|uniref:Circadian clock KaiB family protein n=2 Tax=Hymenobacter TaxID=89966 RepID=A0ABS6X3I7_9BACT|nr:MULTISPECIES: circadian clock KaiB family protein [Hymenobacter]MBO3271274.1 circadian clock KaiB family protein [Hymenobacter defluvii]MBW3130404.1 circadian clock KaiB family protein [Hymenobacter profundi]QNE41360.1 circadian clock protein KaiB [Hymenobacter sp. NBH84]
MATEQPPTLAEADYVFQLFITGATPNSTRAVRNLKDICEQYLAGRYELQIIDIYQQPLLAKEEQIIAAPTLVRKRPLPVRRLIGDLSERATVLATLGLPDPPTTDDGNG